MAVMSVLGNAEKTMVEEGRNRRRNIIVLGGMILAGALIPVLGPAREYLGPLRAGAPWTDIQLALGPALIGLAVILLGTRASERVRGYGLVLLMAVVFAIGYVAAMVTGVGQKLLAQGRGVDDSTLLVMAGCCAGPMLLFVGCRSRFYRPASPMGGALGVLGAVTMVAALMAPMPVGGQDKGLADAVWTVVTQGSAGPGFLKAVIVMAAMACMLLVATLCLVNVMIRDEADGKAMAKFAFQVWVCGIALNYVAVFPTLAVTDYSGFGEWLGSWLFMLKVLLLLVGLGLLLPVALTDMIVGPSVPARVGKLT